MFKFIHNKFFHCIILSYAIAGVFPQLGLWIRKVEFGSFLFFDGSTVKISLPIMMLSALLLNAGLGIQKEEIANLFKYPKLLIFGLTANLIIPVGFTYFISLSLQLWHNPDEVQNILVGLALIASMPIAASSTAWAQKSNGNLALSLSLVLFSTLLSPVTTPIGLHSIGWMANGDYAEDLHEIAWQGTGAFLFISVLFPTSLGVLLHFIFPEKITKAIKRPIKDINLINLLMLNYVNASIVLPQVFVNPDWDFLVAIVIITGSLCILAFYSGSIIARLLDSPPSEKSSLMFGLGMNNNGTGLVLASLSLSDHPTVMLPIICYNLIQHIIAGYVDYKLAYIPDR
ncbi:MAG: bile acid:sodium symporter [Proteobacteria bacterium]|nr:bile acid:sodium symporter [Pseudomonadota bacterium]